MTAACLPGRDCDDPTHRASDSRVAAGILIAVVILVALVATFVTGCAPSEPYRRADRMTFDAIAPEYSAYVAGDAGLSPKAKERRFRTLRTWDVRSSTGKPEPEPQYGEGD